MRTKSTHRFLLEVEDAIAKANRLAIKQRLGPLRRRRFMELAAKVAEIRADYLHAAFHIEWAKDSCPTADLESKRHRYEEAVAAYDALERAVERGYVEFED